MLFKWLENIQKLLTKVYWRQFIHSESTPPVQYQAEWTLQSALHYKRHQPLPYILDHLFYRTRWRLCLWANSYESKKCLSVRSLSFSVIMQRFKTKFSIFFFKDVALKSLSVHWGFMETNYALKSDIISRHFLAYYKFSGKCLHFIEQCKVINFDFYSCKTVPAKSCWFF